MPNPAYRYAAVLDRVVDGDTVRLNVDLGFRVHVIETFRLTGIDCPEMVTIEGAQARNATVEWFRGRAALTVDSSRTDRYGRWLAIITGEDGSVLNEWLVEMGHAVLYGDRRA